VADPRAELDALPRLGWVDEPSPVTALPDLARDLGLGWLGVKRDDLLPRLHGGSKVRKLDVLLATPPFAEAPGWASWGAIGSGHLVALSAAARELDRRLLACTFWQPASDSALANLAYVASGPGEVQFHGSRVALALRRPQLVVGGAVAGLPSIAPGATTGAGVAGVVRAGLELADQIAAGELPTPDRIVLPIGSAGTTIGLLLGLGLAGLRPVVHAVSAVERWFLLAPWVRRLTAQARAWLVEHGVAGARGVALPPLRVDFARVGPGYGIPTAASEAACRRLAEHELALEPVYSGKAMASLLAAPPAGERVLFWLTPHGAGPLPAADDWRERLPTGLRQRLDADGAPGRRVGRRALLAGGAALAAGALWRTSGYPALPEWSGRVLAPWQAHVLRACAEALLPPAPLPGRLGSIPARVDRFVQSLPAAMTRELLGLTAALEHGTTPLGHAWSRLTALPVEERRAFLADLAAAGGLRGELYRGVRELVYLGYYQQPETWPALGYRGPLVPEGPRADRYGALVAPPGALPRGFQEGAG